ncbi:MAG: DUF3427 domain-containing protein [Mediterraneibacter faecis]
MHGMKRIGDDVFIFITYHKEESQNEKNYVDGKPDYADAFEDNQIFKWDSRDRERSWIVLICRM